jgi:hypothetical protein
MAMAWCHQTGAGSARLPERVRIRLKRCGSRLPTHSRRNDDAVLDRSLLGMGYPKRYTCNQLTD